MYHPLVVELKAFGVVICSQTNESSSDRNGNEQGYPQRHGDYEQVDDETHGERRRQDVTAASFASVTPIFQFQPPQRQRSLRRTRRFTAFADTSCPSTTIISLTSALLFGCRLGTRSFWVELPNEVLSSTPMVPFPSLSFTTIPNLQA